MFPAFSFNSRNGQEVADINVALLAKAKIDAANENNSTGKENVVRDGSGRPGMYQVRV